MAIFALDDALYFPPAHLAEPDGLLAIGGNLSPERLLLAYRSGIFPWYSEPPILWWCPNPRFVLFPNELKISKSLHSLLKKNVFQFTIDTAFKDVITNCKTVSRTGEPGTWINEDMIAAYTRLHEIGYAQSAEVWLDGKLVGGLYGIKLGNVFFGESMFSLVSNASKYAFVKYIQQLIKEDIKLVDCQVYSQHLESLGARMIDIELFLKYINKAH